MWWSRKHRPNPFYRWQELADYNSRVSKGIVHTQEYKARMAQEQSLFDDWHKREAEEKGWIV
jgi:hypothetical protein